MGLRDTIHEIENQMEKTMESEWNLGLYGVLYKGCWGLKIGQHQFDVCWRYHTP